VAELLTAAWNIQRELDGEAARNLVVEMEQISQAHAEREEREEREECGRRAESAKRADFRREFMILEAVEREISRKEQARAKIFARVVLMSWPLPLRSVALQVPWH
jgi:hypothetical protein